jgi:membrane protein required for colicin V production
MIIDIVFIILLIIALLKGSKKGLIQSLFTFLAFFVGLAAAIKLSAIVANQLAHQTTIGSKWIPFISFILVFAVVVIIVKALGKFIEKANEMIMLGWVNKIGGVLFYLFLYGIIFSILLFYLKNLGILKPTTIENSKFYPFLSPLAPDALNLIGNIIPFFKDVFGQLERYFGIVSENIS